MNAKIVRAREAHERKMIPNGDPKILYEAHLGALVGFPMLIDQGEGYIEKTLERFVRPPGTRIIAVRDSTVYLQKEYRSETKSFDWRLPGGKVVDSFEEYRGYIGKEMSSEAIIAAALRELREEAQLEAVLGTIFKKSSCGASVEWDLYYVIVYETKEVEYSHNEGEEIEEGKWVDFETLLAMCTKGEIGEDRTVSALYQFIQSRK